MQSINEGDYRGIDISNWQGTVDFNAVKNSGVQIVYIKSTEADYFLDPYLNSNYSNAKSAGLLVGFYHFFRADVNAKDQARYFANAISGKVPDCRLALDIETSEGYNASQLSAMCVEFLEEVKRITGYEVVVYTYTYFAQTNLTRALSVYPVWIAHYGVDTPGYNPIWDSWVGFQYSSTGTVPGVNGPCDLNVFTSGIFTTENPPQPPDPNPIPPTGETIYYTVRPGDTLSEIALNFNTTWQYLAQINNLSDPNMIFVGQVLLISNGSSPTPPPTSNVTYTVQAGDTLSEIASNYGTTWQYLAQINNISDPNLIFPGQVLLIQSSSQAIPPINPSVTYTVQSGDTLSGIASDYGTTWQHLAQLNNLSDPNLIFPGQVLVIR
ncbi:MAG: LysM peptidoglycan-binding domain-containing protein [Clostridium sp.]